MDYLLIILATVAVIFGGKAVWDWKKNRTPHLNLEELEDERAQYLQENFEKANNDFNWLEDARKNLHDRELSTQLDRMQRVAKNLLNHLEKNPERIPLANKFIDYYQDRAVRIVKQYQDLEATQLSTDRVRDLKIRMKQTLSALDDAYEEQFEHVLNDQFLSADAELTVMEQQLDSEGIKRRTVEEIESAESSVKIDTDLLDRPIEILEPERKNLPVMQKRQRKRRNRQIEKANSFPEEQRPKIIQRKLIQSALAIFLGSIGAHKFYQGKTFQGIIYIVFFWTMLPGFIGFIEGVRYLFMPVEDFYNQYFKE